MIKRLLGFPLIFILTAGPLWGQQQWPAGGTHIARSASSLVSMAAAPDGKGGTFLVYEHSPQGDADIYAQWIDASGALQWGSSGIVVTSAGGDQRFPAVAPDGQGGIYVAWQDEITASSSIIYAQRFDSNGNAVWTGGDVVICNATGFQYSTKMVPVSGNMAVMVWADKRGGSTSDLYAQKINLTGSVQWTANGSAVTTAADNQAQHVIIGDGSGGAYVAWRDYRNGNFDIYAQRMDTNGNQDWTANGIQICTETNNQIAPAIDTSGSQLIITWEDKRTGTSDIYAQAVAPNGSVQWGTNGQAVCTTAGAQMNPKICRDGENGAIIAWSDDGTAYDIYGQKLNSSGTDQWTANGLLIDASNLYQVSPEVVPDDSGGAFIAWKDYRSGSSYGIYAQHINRYGDLVWPADSMSVVDGDINYGQNHFLIPDESGGAIVLWQDERDSQHDIYGQHFNDNLDIKQPQQGAQWAGDQSHTISWGLRTTDTIVDHLTILCSETPGDGYPITVQSSLSPASLSTSWTPGSVNGNQVRIRIEARNSDNVTIARYISPEFTIDSDPPNTFDLISPSDGASVGNQPTFQWQSTTDNLSGLDHYELWIDNQLVEDNLNTTQYTLSSLQQLTDGAHTWTVKAVDQMGLIRQATSTWDINVASDSDPPNPFNLLSPSDNSWTTDTTPAFSWESTSDAGSGLKKFQLYINGQLERDNIDPSVTSVSNLTLSAGTYTWYIIAMDSATNTRQSNQTWTINIDNVQPQTFDLLMPADNNWIPDTTPTFTWEASLDNGIGLTEYELWVDDNLYLDNLSPSTPSVTLTPQQALSEGSHTWYVIARDGLGNQRQSNFKFAANIDATNPQGFGLISPSNNSLITETSPTFTWQGTVDNLSGIDEYQLWINGSLNKDGLSGTSSPPAAPLPEGNYTWQVRAFDRAGNGTNTAVYNLTIDWTPPEPFQLISPYQNEVLHTNDITFEWHSTTDQVSGFDQFKFYIDGQLKQDNLGSQDTVIVWYQTLADGQHTWHVVALDQTGNERSSQVITFSLERRAPEITSPGTASATEDIPFSYTASATDPDNDPVFISFEDYPDWLTPSGSQISGTPGEGNQDTSFVIVASDAIYETRKKVTVTVQAVNDPPVITSATAVTATEDVSFTYTATATDPENSTVNFTFSNYPNWLTPSGNQISGTPVEGTPNTSFTVTASDGSLTDQITVNVTVQAVNDPPVITSATSASATEHVLFTYTATATDPENGTVNFTFTNYPAWLTPSGSQISGTPGEGDGNTSFTVTASDGSLTDQITVNVTVQAVNDPPVITSATAVTATEDVPFNYTATATDPENSPITFTFQNLPAWLTAADNQVNGTPVEGTSNASFTVTASDGSLTDQITVNVTVQAVNDPPVITSAISASATEHVLFTYTATATDPENATVNFTFTNYPAWLTPSGSQISGTPGEGDGNTSFTVTASDGSLTDQITVNVSVQSVNDPPVITSAAVANATEDVLFTYTATATDPENAPVTFTFTNYPNWLTPSGNQISGTPVEGMSNTSFTLTASDGSLTDQITVNVLIQSVNDPPQITSATSASATEDVPFNYTATATDPENSPVTFTFQNLPAWLVAADNQVNGTPTEGVQDTSFVVIASDGSLTDQITVNVTVQAVNDAPQITSPTSVTATEDVLFTYTATATDPENDALMYIFQNCPGWMTPLDNQISGTPTEGVQDTSFVLTVSDGSLTDQIIVNITIQAVNDPPQITSSDSVTAIEDELYIYTASATDPENDPVTYTFLDYPAWMTPADNQISGTPVETTQDTSFVLIASDGSLTNQMTVKVTIQGVNDPPKLTSTSQVTAVEDSLFTYRATATDVDGPVISFQFIHYPHWMTPSGPEISGTPLNGDQDTTFQVVASDNEFTDTLTVAVKVIPVNDPPYFTYELPHPSFTAIDTLDWNFALGEYADDPDDPVSFLVWSWALYNTDPSAVNVDIVDSTKTAHIVAINPDKDIHIIFTVTDPSGASASDTLSISFVYSSVENPFAIIPEDYILYDNYPNPFNPATTIRYGLPETGHVSLIVYNMLGREVDRLVDEKKKKGIHEITWDAGRHASGIYFYRIQAGDWQKIKRMILIK